jgi:hypothetical protein
MLFVRRNVPEEEKVQRELILWLGGGAVGRMTPCGKNGPWHFGRFAPAPSFGRFAPRFAEWARVMHARSDVPLTDEQRAKLADIERSIDALRAWCAEPGRTSRRRIAQLNIDGEMIEWKER